MIKSPPRMSFIRQVHKLSRPFFNEVSWYLDLVPQLELVHGKGKTIKSKILDEIAKPSASLISGTIDHILPTCYHAYSSYYSDHEGQGTCCTRTCPWWCWLPFRRSEQGVLILENITMREGTCPLSRLDGGISEEALHSL